ncbi:MAG TPA: hypothetical protein VGU73_12370 [Acidimicrobiia bacterium]|nr:hypothetical protein [Acidimicrobiia bacterium]
MRKHWTAVLGAAVLGAALALAAAVPAGAKGGGSTSTTGVTSPKVTSCSKSTALKGVTAAMDDFLSGNANIFSTYVDQGVKIGPSYLLSEQLDTAAGLTSPTTLTLPTAITIKCTGKNKLTFTYGLYLKDKTTSTTGPPLGITEAGDALIEHGHWFISASTVCDLEAGAGAVAAQASNECYTAAGLPVPPQS